MDKGNTIKDNKLTNLCPACLGQLGTGSVFPVINKISKGRSPHGLCEKPTATEISDRLQSPDAPNASSHIYANAVSSSVLLVSVVQILGPFNQHHYAIH